jgi:hypothetical protein
MLQVKFQSDGDRRRYTMVAIKGVGHCNINTMGYCKNWPDAGSEKPHVHEAVTREGYEAAAEWVTAMTAQGWHVTVMDRTY